MQLITCEFNWVFGHPDLGVIAAAAQASICRIFSESVGIANHIVAIDAR